MKEKSISITDFQPIKDRLMADESIYPAFVITVLLAIVFVPYWWLGVVWSRTVLFSPDVRFAFTTTTLLLVLSILDGIFLFRYYQLRAKQELFGKEEELKKSEALYRSIITASPDGIAISDYQGNLRMVSSSVVSIFGGSSEDEFMGRNVRELFPATLPETEESISALLTGQSLHLSQFLGRRIDGSCFPTEVHSDVIRDREGEPTDIVYIIRDITERENIQAQVRENEELFHTIFQEMSDPLLILDGQGVILDINRSGEEQMQITKDRLLGKELLSSGLFTPENEDRASDFIHHSKSGEKLAIQITYPSGADRFVLLKVTTIRIRGLQGTLLLIHDIDEIKRVQNALTQANKQLNLLNSITRHDILNRVTIVNGYCDVLQGQVTDPRILNQIQAISNAGNDIRQFIEFTREYQDLGGKEPVWQEIHQLFGRRSVRSLLTDLSLTLPVRRVEILADPMLERVIYNLIENSRRHGEHVRNIGVSCRQEGTALLICYTDDGIGIEAREKTKIFQKGYGKNTGLGLFLIREILGITNITIEERGEPGKGVVFIMTIPQGCFRFPPAG